MKITKLFLLSLFLLVTFLTPPLHSADDFLSSRVKDISDRNYEEAVIELLDNAKDSIVISMYSISLGSDTNNPVKLLLNDLLEARDRGVSVTLYINTRFRRNAKKPFIQSPIFKKLEEVGSIIHLLPSKRKLHDKLVIVDNRYVVEGSTNWSIVALRGNFESSTLIDSPALARVKLARLENILIISAPRDEKPPTPAYLKNLPQSLTIPKDLLLSKKYFSRMLTKQDSRAMDLYLLLLAHSQATNKQEFFVSLENIALSLGMPGSWTDTALRRQVIKSLKKLQNRYHLINVKFFYGRDAAVRFTGIPGGSFTISSDSIISQDAKLTMRLKFLLLLEAVLKGEGKDLYSVSQSTLAKRFNVHLTTISAAFKDLHDYTQ